MQAYASLTDLDRAKYNSFIRVKAANIVIHPQFFEQENIMPKTHAAVFTVFEKLTATVAATDLTTSDSITEPTAADLSEAQVTVTAYEVGQTVGTTQAIDYTSIVELAEAKKLIVAINMAEGLDNCAAYRIYAALSSTAAVLGPLTSTMIFTTARDFYDGSVPVRGDGLYGAICSPMTQYDIFGDPDKLKGFVPVKQYTDGTILNKMEIGAYGGFRWSIGPSAYHATVDGSRHDYPILFGAGAFGQANGYDPEMVLEDANDVMHRFRYVSWKAQRGYGVICSSYVRQYDVVPTA
jgi:hypothetical protein